MADNSTPQIIWGPSPPPPSPPPSAAPQIVWGNAPPAAPSPPAPSALSSIGASLGKGFGESMLGAQQLVGKGLSEVPYGQTPGQWLQKNAAQGISNLQQQEAPYQAAHPNLTGVGEFAGQAGAAIAPEGLLGDIAPAATWLGRAGQAVRQGGISGAEQYVPGSDYWKQKVGETAANIGGSMVGQQFFEGLGGIGRFMSKYNPGLAEHYAVRKIAKSIADGEKSGYTSAQKIINLFNTAHAAGVPMTLMEAGGKPVKTLAGWAARNPGTPEAIVEDSFDSRLEGATTRIAASIKKNFDAPDTRHAVQEALTASQRAASAPAYAKAFKPGSIAPLKTQFEKAFNDVSKARKKAQQELDIAKQGITLATAKVSRAGNNVYSNSAALRELRSAQANAEDSHGKIQALDNQRGSVLTQLRAAQKAEANGERGGVWSPHIAQMLTNPRIQEGIRRGMKIQRDEADAQFIPFNPTEYAVKLDAKGEPTIFRTPNMRLLDAAKRGLDSVLDDYRDKVTGKINFNEESTAINELRKSWISELDRINPDYSAARAAYAGPAQSKAAMLLGKNILQTRPEDIKKTFDDMSHSEQEHYRIGAAQAYMDAISDYGLKAPEIRKLSEKDEIKTAKERLKPIFRTKAQMDDFLASVTGERAILDTKQAVVGGAPTAARVAADAAHNADKFNDAAQAVRHGLNHNIPGFLGSAARFFGRVDPRKSEKVKEQVARILSNPNIKLSSVPGQVIDVPARPPPGKFTSAALASTPIGRALGAQAGSGFESMISGQ